MEMMAIVMPIENLRWGMSSHGGACGETRLLGTRCAAGQAEPEGRQKPSAESVGNRQSDPRCEASTDQMPKITNGLEGKIDMESRMRLLCQARRKKADGSLSRRRIRLDIPLRHRM